MEKRRLLLVVMLLASSGVAWGSGSESDSDKKDSGAAQEDSRPWFGKRWGRSFRDRVKRRRHFHFSRTKKDADGDMTTTQLVFGAAAETGATVADTSPKDMWEAAWNFKLNKLLGTSLAMNLVLSGAVGFMAYRAATSEEVKKRLRSVIRGVQRTMGISEDVEKKAASPAA